MIKRAPSLIRTIQTDYTAFLAFLFPVIFWGLYLFFTFSSMDAAGFADISIAVTAAGLLILLWRYWLLRSVFHDGVEVPGVVSDIYFFRGRGRVSYIYTYQGQKYISGNAINKTKRTRSLVQGEQVTLVIDPNNPKRAFIRDLYL